MLNEPADSKNYISYFCDFNSKLLSSAKETTKLFHKLENYALHEFILEPKPHNSYSYIFRTVQFHKRTKNSLS